MHFIPCSPCWGCTQATIVAKRLHEEIKASGATGPKSGGRHNREKEEQEIVRAQYDENQVLVFRARMRHWRDPKQSESFRYACMATISASLCQLQWRTTAAFAAQRSNAFTNTHASEHTSTFTHAYCRDIIVTPGTSLFHLAIEIVHAFDFDFDDTFSFYRRRCVYRPDACNATSHMHMIVTFMRPLRQHGRCLVHQQEEGRAKTYAACCGVEAARSTLISSHGPCSTQARLTDKSRDRWVCAGRRTCDATCTCRIGTFCPGVEAANSGISEALLPHKLSSADASNRKDSDDQKRQPSKALQVLGFFIGIACMPCLG
jgi:hypothetical protein